MNTEPTRRSTRLSKLASSITEKQTKVVTKRSQVIYSDDDSDCDCIYVSETKVNSRKTYKKIDNDAKTQFRKPQRSTPSTPVKNKPWEETDDEETQFKTPPSTPVKNKSNKKTDNDEETLFKKPQRSPPCTPVKNKSSDNEENQAVTPPKQKRMLNDIPIPTTPTVLLERLALNSPWGKYQQKECFEENNDLYQDAKRALDRICPTKLPGRDNELSELRQFIVTHIKAGTSGSLYISGPPGTGKTASLNVILEDISISREINVVYVNCTKIKSSGAIFSRIVKDLGIKCTGKSEKDHTSAIEKYLSRNHKHVLLVLDEIDQLGSKRQSVLYTIFEWPAAPKSKFILIGIANALDLTDRILPRLQSRCELKPQLMHFAPYSKQQLIEIFTNRLKTAGIIDIFSTAALQMLAGKVAAISGDVRRALDIGCRVVELVKDKKRGANVLKAVENLTEELGGDKRDEKKIESVGLKEVMTVLNNVYGTTQNLDEEMDDGFPMQQKILICSILLILKKAKNKELTLGRLHDVYCRICRKRNINVIGEGEFAGMCSLIEARGMITIIKKKEMRMQKIMLLWDEEEVGAVLKDKQLLAMILQDDGYLGKM